MRAAIWSSAKKTAHVVEIVEAITRQELDKKTTEALEENRLPGRYENAIARLCGENQTVGDVSVR